MKAPEVPVWALVHLTHAALQRIADDAGVDLLHIKGPAIRTSLRIGIHDSTDADVLVRPAHVERITAALAAHGWELHTGFDEGSPFGHAANFRHPAWTYADVHQRVPGCRASDDAVFDALWADRDTAQIAHYPCQVVSVPAQVAVQVMHAARSHGNEKPESWILCPEPVRPAVRQLVTDLQATTAFAAGIGELTQHRDAPDHALWSYWSNSNEDRLDEWAGRLRAASGVGERLSVLHRGLHVNRTHLRLRLDREPTGADVAREQIARVRLGIVSLWHHMRTRTETNETDAGAGAVADVNSSAADAAAVATSFSNETVPPTGAASAAEAADAPPSATGPVSIEPGTSADAHPSVLSVVTAVDPLEATVLPAPAGSGARHVVAPGVAWLDATDAGRTEPIAWTARLDTAELHELPQASWMVWLLIADGIGTVEGLRAEIDALGASIDFGDEGLDGFLARLDASGLIVEVQR